METGHAPESRVFDRSNSFELILNNEFYLVEKPIK